LLLIFLQVVCTLLELMLSYRCSIVLDVMLC